MDECDDEYNKTTVAITDDPSGAEACFCMIFWSCPWRDPTEDDTEANRCVSFFLESSGDTRHVMYFNTDLKLHKKHKEYICTGDGTGLVHWHSAVKHPD